LLGIGAGRNGEVIFQVSAVGVEDEVNAFVDIRDFYVAVLRDVIDRALEIAIIEIVTDAAGGLGARYVLSWSAARKLHPYGAVLQLAMG